MRTSNHNPKRQILSEHPIANVLKGLIIIILFTIVSQSAFAQVGINNTDPKATLDITVTDPNSPAATDGILVPRVNTLTFTGLNSDQNGMLVYLTTDVTISSVLYLKGFYYWDDSISDWIKVGSGSKNTLDQAYDEGGAGVGRTITADNGAILINGNDGFQNTGTFGFGTFLDLSGPGTRMFFYPRKAAFRVGTVNGNLWDEPFIGNYSTAIGFNTRATGSRSIAMGFSTLASNVSSIAIGTTTIASGNYSTAIGRDTEASGSNSTAMGNNAVASGAVSTAMGYNTEASGSNSTAMGNETIASGSYSIAMGRGTEAPSFAETSIGLFNTIYTPNSDISPDNADRIFSIGNGDTSISRSNALTIYKNGLMNINDAYDMPLTDGTANQVMATNGAGVVRFEDVSNLFTDTDNQTIETFSFNSSTNELTLEIEDDGIGAQTVDLSTLITSDVDWYEEGTTSAPNSINDNIFTQGRVGVGDNTPEATLDVNHSGSDLQAVIVDFATNSNSIGDISSSGNIPAGLRVNTQVSSQNRQLSSGLFSITGTATSNPSIVGGLAVYNSVSTPDDTFGFGVLVDAESNESIGIANQVTSSPSITNYGIQTIVNGASNTNYGGEFRVTGMSNTNYGVYSSAYGATTNWAGYFGNVISGSGNVYVQDLLEVDGTLNYTDGNESAGFILESNASGDSSWVDPATVFTDNDDQTIDNFSFNTSTNELTLEIEDDGVIAQSVDLSSLSGRNTLDQAYDEGGAGNGRIITADNGAILIQGNDGFQNTGTHNSGTTLALSGAGTRMFFYPRKSAFRAGYINGTQWDNNIIGNYSVAMNFNTTASGNYSTAMGAFSNASSDFSVAMGSSTSASGIGSTAMGNSSIASGGGSTAMGQNTNASGGNSTAMGANNNATGLTSTAMGQNTNARSFAETSIGIYNNSYSPSGINTYNINDQLFSIGNGTNSSNRSNALTIYKSGLMNINDEYDMPLTDGTANQIMTTDGAGNVTFQNAPTFTDTNTQNTLDQAYDEGGAGAGRTIIVDNGAVVIEGNAGGLSATTSAQLILTETTEDDYSRLRFTNSVDTNNTWTIATRTDDTPSLSRMNFNHNGVGDLFQLWGDGFVEVNGIMEIDGQLGININNPTFAIELPNSTLDGTGRGLAQSWQTYSDSRVKSDQIEITKALEKLLKITPKTYFHHDSKFENNKLVLSNTGEQTLGFIAQDLYEILPEAVRKPQDENTNLWSVNYQKVIPLAVKAIQELNEDVVSLKSENAILKAKLQQFESLEARLTALENNTESSKTNKIVSKED